MEKEQNTVELTRAMYKEIKAMNRDQMQQVLTNIYDTKPGMADYMLAVMNQILGSAAVEKEVSETEKVRIREINEVTVTERYMTIREWEVNA